MGFVNFTKGLLKKYFGQTSILKNDSTVLLFLGTRAFEVIGHPPARETSQDGQYESGVRERVNLTPMPAWPEVNHLT